METQWTSEAPFALHPSLSIPATDCALRRYCELGIALPPEDRLQRARRFLKRPTVEFGFFRKFRVDTDSADEEEQARVFYKRFNELIIQRVG